MAIDKCSISYYPSRKENNDNNSWGLKVIQRSAQSA